MKIIYLFSAILFLATCIPKSSKKSADLHLISNEEIINRAKAGTFNYIYATFLNQDGTELTKEEKALLNKGQLGKDYYQDNQGAIREIRVRPITTIDKLIDIQRIEISSQPLKNINLVEIDCNSLNEIYDEVQRTDQEVRMEGVDMMSVDRENLGIVVSAITKCGWTEDHLETIWLVFQHSDSDVMAYFYSDLKSFSDQGKLRKSSMALMEDRLLMYHGYKQIYGSQITNDGLYTLEDPENVNERRASMGLGTIEEYIENWNLNFTDEVKRMQTMKNENFIPTSIFKIQLRLQI